jgi:hypothetical protein
MTRFLRRSLTNADLLEREERSYEGRIERVVEQKVFNKWKFTKDERVPVIEFDNGWTWIPNQRALKVLMKSLGSSSSTWPGRRLRVFLKAVERTEAISGRGVEKLEKFVEVLDDPSEEALL